MNRERGSIHPSVERGRARIEIIRVAGEPVRHERIRRNLFLAPSTVPVLAPRKTNLKILGRQSGRPAQAGGTGTCYFLEDRPEKIETAVPHDRDQVISLNIDLDALPCRPDAGCLVKSAVVVDMRRPVCEAEYGVLFLGHI